MSKKILLVEDEVLIAMSEAQMLKRHGYEVVTAHSGERAIEAVDSNPDISLVLMDIDLGSAMDGTEAAETILERHDLPIAFLSSHTEPEVVEKTEGITSYGYIVKNSGETVLLASIRMAFRLYEAHMELKRQKENLGRALIEQEQTAEQLEDSEEKFRTMMSQSIDMIFLHDLDGNIVDVNQAAVEQTGYSSEKLHSMTISDLDPDYVEREDGGHFWKNIEYNRPYRFDAQLRRKDDSLFPAEIVLSRVLLSGNCYIMTFARDISERKRAEYELMAREETLRITLNSIGEAVISTDIAGTVVRMNAVAEALCGWGVAEARGKALEEVFHIVHADTGERVENPVAMVLETGNITGLANHTMLISKDGTEYQIADSAAPIRDDSGNIAGVVLVFRDVTDEYEKEEQIRESERKYRGLFNSIREAILVADTNRNIVDCNSAFTRLFGYGVDEIRGRKTISVYAREEEFKQMGRALEQHRGDLSEFLFTPHYKKKDGTVFPGETSVLYLRDDMGSITGFVGLIRDVTQRTLTEEALRENNRTAHQFFSESAAGAFFMMLDHPIEWNESVDKEQVLDYVFDHQRITQVNRAMLDQYLAQEEDFLGKTPNELFAHDVEHGRSLWRKMFDQGFLSIDSDERRFDGSQLHIVGSYRCMYDQQGKVIGHFGTQHDVTDQKAAEVALRENEKRLAEAQKLAHVGSWEYDVASNTILGSEEGFRIYGLEPPASWLLPIEQIEACIPDSSRVHQALVDLIEESIPYALEFELHPADKGEPRTIFSQAELLKDPEGNPVRVRGVIQDITERKRAEEEIQRQLSEKETLLREVNHRIKNSISQVESLLSLQASSADDVVAKTALQDAISRVRSIRILYEKLLIGRKHQDVSTREYAESVIDSLVAVFPERHDVTVEKRIADFTLNSKIAVPLGVIINELLTNVLKHAFAGTDGGTVVIELVKTENQVTLTIHDNGVGLYSRRVADKSPGFGLTIVRMLAEQLDGTYTIENDRGTKSVLSFSVPQ